MSAPLNPEVRAVTITTVAERLQETFLGTTAVDLDALAVQLVDDLIAPAALRAFTARETMFQAALEASMAYAVGELEAFRRKIEQLKEENNQLLATNQELLLQPVLLPT